jgi:hypothetical protein
VTQGQEQVSTQAEQPRVVGGRYTVLGEIGRGGMGVVWLAEDRMIGRRVAIKELHLPEGVPNDDRHVFEERVLREARTAGRLNDPAVVTVYDVLHESGTTYIVMELIEAPTLSDVVRQHGPLPEPQVASLAEQLLSALEAAHRAGVVHRDVKPSNIMLAPNGRAKLTDFGIAQSLDDPKLTTSGILIGSPTYMAPERIRGLEATPPSDLWALGAVLFFAVEGYAPYERQSTAATMHAILNEIPHLTRCRGPLASVILGLLIGTPEARLSAPQMRAMLAQATLQGPGYGGDQTAPVRGTSVYAAPGVTGRTRMSRAGRIGVVTLAIVMLAAGLVGGWFANPLLTGGGFPPSNMEPAMTYGPGGEIPEFELSSGSNTCLDGKLEPNRRYPSSASGECTDLHDIEVYDYRETFKTTTSSDASSYQRPVFAYPGEETLARFAEPYCAASFASEWVKLPQGNKGTDLKFRALIPSRESWDASQKDAEASSSDDSKRVFYCVVWRADGNQMDVQLQAGDN